VEKWGNCKLSKVLVDEEKLRSTTELYPEEYPVGTVHIPGNLGYGVKHEEKILLFEQLPMATLHMTSQVRKAAFSKEMRDKDDQAEIQKANLLAKVLDLRNANAAGIAYENRRRIVEAFSTTENPFDTGRTEVQGMYKILPFRLFEQCRNTRFPHLSCAFDIQNPQSVETPPKFQARCGQPTEFAEARPPTCQTTSVSKGSRSWAL
jgi:hypothetical protein